MKIQDRKNEDCDMKTYLCNKTSFRLFLFFPGAFTDAPPKVGATVLFAFFKNGVESR